MMFPSIFGENVFDDWNDDNYGLMNPSAFFGKGNPLYGKHAGNIMKTDIRETDKTYEMDVDLPGFSKENIQVQLEKGYLTIVASKALDKDEKNKEGKYLRQERYSGTCSRSFYVGEALTNEDIKAKFEDGVLKLSIPKKDAKEIDQNKYIAIEG
ncbi:MAG: Hsp20/alpha crystallin family protein [Succiniclasticum sp.]|jgi:HSP20 family molecular chaperone IbpA|nr:Hsp20/alpha crystallin family protein [Succiniclasticum sp.]MEE3479485.1 Hsp20/alpha crystallin family protein [Succiniclasticum sp.]